MSERLTLRSFKGPTVEVFRMALQEAVDACGGMIFWECRRTRPEEDLRLTHQENVHTVFLPYLNGADHLLCRLVAGRLDVPWIETRIQEGAFWDYSLYSGLDNVDNFSCLPEYWGPGDTTAMDAQRGRPQLLADVWQVPRGRIERYLQRWNWESVFGGSTEQASTEKAYDSDSDGYGSIYQMFDFLSALGAADPMAHGVLHRIIVPSIENLEKALKSLGKA
ncbi:MAG TPA: hypothetical protein VG826_06000 [Pirellulales bacterium]|nr:hypothetical protein [Pirellulales bacterium]